MLIPTSALEPFGYTGMPTLERNAKTMVHFIDIAMGIKQKWLQHVIDTYGKSSHMFDLGDLRTIAREFGANHIEISDVSKGFIEFTYSVPNDQREYVRRFHFNLNDKHPSAGVV